MDKVDPISAVSKTLNLGSIPLPQIFLRNGEFFLLKIIMPVNSCQFLNCSDLIWSVHVFTTSNIPGNLFAADAKCSY